MPEPLLHIEHFPGSYGDGLVDIASREHISVNQPEFLSITVCRQQYRLKLCLVAFQIIPCVLGLDHMSIRIDRRHLWSLLITHQLERAAFSPNTSNGISRCSALHQRQTITADMDLGAILFPGNPFDDCHPF